MGDTLTLLFTDAVASTEALSRLGDERFGQVQSAHLDALRAVVLASGGREVKSLGDGLMVAFTGAADALACAVKMQQSVELSARRGEAHLPLRIGLSLGDVTVDSDGDCHGTAVVEAARLCAVAAGGQVLATDMVRQVAGSRGGHAYTPLGPVELKGLRDPVSAIDVGWAPVVDDATGLAPLPLPAPLAGDQTWPFVGRSTEVKALDELWSQAAAGQLRVALLGGEPGAGKTRLAREFAASAHGQGALVLFGRVEEDLAVAYQPFVEALRHYLTSVDAETRTATLTLRGGALARLVPDLVETSPAGQADAWAVFEGLVDWLAFESVQRPVLLVVDDLHWAAKPTLQALMHLVRSARLTRVLVVATYRDTELGRDHPLAKVLADLRREDGVQRLIVRGLDVDGVREFLRAARGDLLSDAGSEFAKTLAEQTQGNPFFVGEVLRHFAETGDVQHVDGRWVRGALAEEHVVPDGVREVVARRVARLSHEAGELLAVAAVIGPQFDIATATEVAGQPVGSALDALDDALSSGLLHETSTPGRLQFAHALVRQALVEELSTMRRMHLHQRIGLALERRFAGAEAAVPDLAHHFAQAAALGEGDRAAGYTERAGALALTSGAPEQAIELFDRALALLPADADPSGTRRSELLAQLVWCHVLLVDAAAQQAVILRWLALADECRDDVMRVLAASAHVHTLLGKGPLTAGDVVILTEALQVDTRTLDLTGHRRLARSGAWGPLDAPGLRAELLGSLALGWGLGVPLGVVGEVLPGRTPLELAHRAAELARTSSDRALVQDATWWELQGKYCHPDAELLRREAEDAMRFGSGAFGGGRQHLMAALARLGLLDDLAMLSAEARGLAERKGDRQLVALAHCCTAIEALARGRWDEAAAATDRLHRTVPDDLGWRLAVALQTVCRHLGSGQPDAARVIAEALDEASAIDFSLFIGVAGIAQADLAPARLAIERWRAAGSELQDDVTYLTWLWGLTECASACGDRDAAGQLYEHVLPFDGQLLLVGVSFVPASAAYVLGRLSETLGDHDRARGHLAEALAFEGAIGAGALVTRTQEALGRL